MISIQLQELMDIKEEMFEIFTNTDVDVDNGMVEYPQYILDMNRSYRTAPNIGLGGSSFEITPEFEGGIDAPFMFKSCENLRESRQYAYLNAKQAFFDCSNLKTVPLMKLTNITGGQVQPGGPDYGTFWGCENLENLGGFPGLDFDLFLDMSPLLTHESLMNVINNLAMNPGPYRKRLVLGETNLSKLSENDIVIATDKGWTLS